MTQDELLRRFGDLLTNTGGNDPAELIADLDRDKNMMRTNVVRFTLAVAVQSQVGLLHRLHEAGALKIEEDAVTDQTEDPAGREIKPGAGFYVQPDAIMSVGAGGLVFPGITEVHDVSDGYHTMGDLYDHRRALTIALCRALPNVSWRSRYHHPDDQRMFPGYFIVGLTLPSVGQVSYHYKHKYWDSFRGVHELDHAPKWDRHTPQDVVERLTAWR